MPIYQLAYQSICSPHIESTDLRDVLLKALRYNEQNEITGCLVKFRSEFLQVLEGENEEVINELFDKIVKDPRHNSVQLLYRGYKDSRDYAYWFMGFFNLKTSEVEMLAKTNNLPNVKSLHYIAKTIGANKLLKKILQNFESVI